MTSSFCVGQLLGFLLSILEQTVFIDFTMAESSTRKSTRLRKREIEFIARKDL